MENICRVCTAISDEKHLQSMFCNTISERLCMFMNLEQNDEFPQQLCSKCVLELNIAYNFKMKCIESDAKVLRMLTSENPMIFTEVIPLPLTCSLDLDDEINDKNDEMPINSLRESKISQLKDLQIEIVMKKEYPSQKTQIKKVVKKCTEPSLDKEIAKKYKCEECPKSFAFQANLKEHIKRVHVTEYKCLKCFKLFKHKGLLQLHAKTHNIYKCPQCPKDFFKKYRMLKHLRIHSADKHSFACPICSKLYTEYGNLLRHQKTHTGVRPFVCEMCGAAFGQKTTLQSHMKTHDRLQMAIKNNLIQGLNCKLCDEQTTFASPKYLLAHLTRCHSYSTTNVLSRSISDKICDTRNYKCSQCDKCYLTKGQLNIHSASHLSIKPYLCEECGKTFVTKAQLNTHMMIHTNSKPYKCEECGMTFRLQSTLTTHFRQHSGSKPFTCKLCSKSFRQMQHLRRHMRCHTGEKPYSCEVCGKRFVDKNNVVVHMRQHTGDKPYRCQHCDMAFYDAPNLRKHSRKHNKLVEAPYKLISDAMTK